MIRSRSGAIIALALALTAAGCGKGSSGGSTAGEVKTGPGVTDKAISLGILTDTTGAFASLGATVTQGQQLYFDQLNAKGGVCNRDVTLVVKDMGYDVQKAVAAYAEMSPNVAGFAQLLGSPMITALKDSLAEDHMYTAAVSWASSLLKQDNIQITGATYDIEMINGISYLVDEKKINKGDKIGHIYLEGEYGANGLAGSKYAAEKLGLTVEAVQVKATEADMTSAVTKLKAAGVKAIMLTTSPKQTASVAGVAAASGLDVPLLGNNPTYSPLLLGTPAGPALVKNLYISGSIQPLSADTATTKQLLTDFTAKFPSTSTNAGVTYGYAVSKVFAESLKKACDNKDLSREGLENAFRSLKSVETDGITAPLDFSVKGGISSRETRIVRPNMETAKVDGLKTEKDLFESDIAKAYTPS